MLTKVPIKAVNMIMNDPSAEEQDHEQPPKRIIENLFKQHNMRYKDTADAPAILGDCEYQALALRCPQCFKPFVDFLESLQIST